MICLIGLRAMWAVCCTQGCCACRRSCKRAWRVIKEASSRDTFQFCLWVFMSSGNNMQSSRACILWSRQICSVRSFCSRSESAIAFQSSAKRASTDGMVFAEFHIFKQLLRHCSSNFIALESRMDMKILKREIWKDVEMDLVWKRQYLRKSLYIYLYVRDLLYIFICTR